LIFTNKYIYFSATTCDGNNNNHSIFALQNNNADPFSRSFTFQGQVNDSTNTWAIDGTVFEHPSGQLYFIWSGWATSVPGPQLLYIAEMSDPLTISSQRVLISTPTYAWEQSGGAQINEGPEVTIQNNVISLVYSASGL
jgi:GH43 family beta-xylosidase